jgi:hypothetical protein
MRQEITRRQFFETTGITTAALLLLSACSEQEQEREIPEPYRLVAMELGGANTVGKDEPHLLQKLTQLRGKIFKRLESAQSLHFQASERGLYRILYPFFSQIEHFRSVAMVDFTGNGKDVFRAAIYTPPIYSAVALSVNAVAPRSLPKIPANYIWVERRENQIDYRINKEFQPVINVASNPVNPVTLDLMLEVFGRGGSFDTEKADQIRVYQSREGLIEVPHS